MAAVASSSWQQMDGAQVDGRVWIEQTITLTNAAVLRDRYLSDPAADHDARLAAKVAHLEIVIPLVEIQRNVSEVSSLGSLAMPTLSFSVATQNAAALREAYLTATRVEAIMMADYLSTLTNTALQNAFGLNAAQVTNLRTNKLTPGASLAASIRAATGA